MMPNDLTCEVLYLDIPNSTVGINTTHIQSNTMTDMMASMLVFLCIASLQCKLTESVNSTADEETTWTLFDDLLLDYDPRVRPSINGEPVCVYLDVFLSSLDGIDERHLDYTITATIHQRWRDPRLTFNGSTTLPPTSYMIERVWHPTLVIGNAKTAKLYDVSHSNQYVTVDPGGNVTFAQRLLLELSCNMDFHRFPMDIQTCNMDLQSFGLTTSDLVFLWGKQRIEFHSDHLRLPQYVLIGVDFDDCTEQHYNGIFSCVRAQFTMERTLGYYMLQSFIPSIALVMVSWVTFWIDVRASPARVGLGVTIILSVISKTNGVRLDIPPVSYLKAIDVWYTSCLLFVIASLLEYAMVHHLSFGPTKQKHKVLAFTPKQECSSQESRIATNLDTVDTISSSIQTLRHHLLRRDETTGELRTIATAPPCDNKQSQPMQTSPPSRPRTQESAQGRDTSRKHVQEPSSMGCCYSIPGEAHIVDLICRWLFPIAFAIFNICFWAYYLPPQYKPKYLADDEGFVSHSVNF